MTLKSLTHWNYRVVRTTHTHPDGSTETNLGVHEAYYGPAGELSWTVEPVAAIGGSIKELRDELARMLVALEIDVIDDVDQSDAQISQGLRPQGGLSSE